MRPAEEEDCCRSKVVGVCLDEEAHEGYETITSESATFLEELPADKFKRIFWLQRLEAASQKDARTMRWHPLMIRWCLYLRHR